MSRLEGHAFENPLEGFLLCNTPSELYRLRKGSDVLIARVNEGPANESHSSKIRKLTIFLFEIMWVNHRVIKRITGLDVL